MRMEDTPLHAKHVMFPRGGFAAPYDNPNPRQLGSASWGAVTTELGTTTDDRLGHE